jgi:N6-adenosine-specific RNA methylase IME4
MYQLTKELHALAGLDAGAILIDAPIPFTAYSAKGEGPRSPQGHYQCLSIEDLKALPLAAIAAPNCFLFSWIPKRSVFLTVPLMDAWGWRFSGSAFTWVKPNKTKPGWFMSTGYGTRQNSEICWLGRRGSPKRLSKSVHELIVAPVREHSRKPDEVYARIEALCTGPYFELFARQQWPGWICLGNEVDKFQPAQLSSEAQESRAP